MTLSRRTFVGGTLAWLPFACQSQTPASTIPSTTPPVDEPEDRVSASLARGRALDERLHAVIEWHAKPRPALPGELHGLPFVVKDNLDTVDLDTTAGSLALLDRRPSADAVVVDRLRNAGAVLVGKANMSEWANFRSERSQSGWSARGGQCVSPWGQSRCPCGSSSGSAVSVAAGYVPFSIGTETDGSILCPASQCGVVGIKPSAGLVSKQGVVPLSSRQDVVGPMAKTVSMAAQVLGVIAEGQPRYTLDAQALGGAKVGIAKGVSSSGYHAGAWSLFEHACSDMRTAGAEVAERDLAWAADRALGKAEMTALLYEFRREIGEYLVGRGGEQRTLADLIAFNHAHAKQELAGFGQEVFEQAEQMVSMEDVAYLDALRRCETVASALERSLDGLDALIAPTTGPSWVLDAAYGDHFSGGSSTTPAAIAGFPTVTVPMGRVQGLPVGVSFIGRPQDEGRLLSLAYAYEQATMHGQAPAL